MSKRSAAWLLLSVAIVLVVLPILLDWMDTNRGDIIQSIGTVLLLVAASWLLLRYLIRFPDPHAGSELDKHDYVSFREWWFVRTLFKD